MIFINFLVSKIGVCFALYDDRNGDKHPNHDWVSIGIIIVFTAIAVALIYQLKSIIGHGSFDWSVFVFDVLKICSLSIGDCIILFPWAVSYMLVRRKTVELRRGIQWYNHFSDTAIPDKWPLWRRLHWSVRALIWAMFASVFYYLYFLL